MSQSRYLRSFGPRVKCRSIGLAWPHQLSAEPDRGNSRSQWAAILRLLRPIKPSVNKSRFILTPNMPSAPCSTYHRQAVPVGKDESRWLASRLTALLSGFRVPFGGWNKDHMGARPVADACVSSDSTGGSSAKLMAPPCSLYSTAHAGRHCITPSPPPDDDATR